MSDYIPYGRQDISQADIDAVVSVLQSDWLTQGPTIERFERVVADYCGAKYAVAVPVQRRYFTSHGGQSKAYF
jgi:dTDP-4-amino-4,6-dideoxygalactose transaminase